MNDQSFYQGRLSNCAYLIEKFEKQREDLKSRPRHGDKYKDLTIGGIIKGYGTVIAQLKDEQQRIIKTIAQLP